MKITTLLIIAGCLHVSAEGFSQKISLSVKSATLKTVFVELNAQTGFNFLYSDEALANTNPVTLDVKNEDIEKVLELCLKNQPLHYSIVNNTIVIKQKANDPPIAVPPTEELPPLKVKGKVTTAKGDPLPGVSVYIKGTLNGTITDADGNYSIEYTNNDKTLIFSYIGKKKQEINIDARLVIDVLMDDEINMLDEVQVIAYGTTTKRLNVGSISKVANKEIEQQPVTNVFEAIQGRMPGVIVNTTNGAPGAITLTQIRGQNNLSNSPDQFLHNYDQPLYILDGMPLAMQNTPLAGGSLASPEGVGLYQYLTGLSSMNGINPSDIESISILKDADATSIYGSQGSNGVILITTKKGKTGKDRFNVSVNTGPTFASRTVPMMNTQQYLEMRNEALANSGATPNTATDPDLLVFDQNKYTNWMKEFYGGIGMRTDTHISASGGTELTSYLVSGGYTKQTYNYPGDFAENRFSLHSSFAHTSKNKRFTLDFGTDYSYDQNNSSTGGPNVYSGFTMAPNFPDLLDDNGKLVWDYKGFQYNNAQENPLAYTKKSCSIGVYTLNTHLSFKYQVFSSLSVGVNAGYGRISQHNYSSIPIASQNPSNGPQGYSEFIEQNNDMINIEPQLNFTRNISKGVLTALLGGTYRSTTMAGYNINAGPYSSDALLTSIAAGGSPPNVSNQASYYKYVAGFGRINYTWANKYIINLTGNRDGSSNFGPSKQFGNFGSVGLGWILTEEKSIKTAVHFISFAKLSMNYGTSGSDGIGPYQYQPNWAVGPSTPYQGVQGLYPINPLNPVYAWSLNKKFNEQIDLGFFKDRLFVSIATYQNKSMNQLVAYVVPIQTGFSNITTNAPYVVQNKGVEVTIVSKNVVQKDFQWTTNFNIAHNSNKLLSFPDIATSPYASTYVVGQPVNAKILIPYMGVDPQTGVFQFRTLDGTITSFANSSSAYNNVGGDATEIVDLNPKFTGGIDNTFTYKGFSLSLFFQFAKQKGPNYLYSVYSNYITGTPGQPLVNMPVAMLERWQKPGDIANIQRFSEGFYSTEDMYAFMGAHYFTASTGAYSDASYIRLKTLSFSYRIPTSQSKKTFFEGSSVFINAQNLLLLTNYEVGDPETMNIFSIPPQRTFVVGLNINF